MANTQPVKLSQNGVAAVALGVACLVALAGNGFLLEASMAAYALNLLVRGNTKNVASIIPSARQALRAVCWVVVAAATLAATQGTTAPGGAQLGLCLAAALAVALRLTRNTR